MSKYFLAGLAIVVATSASAQNIAVVNGRPIPKERADLFLKELSKQGQQVTPELAALVRQELVDREVLLQEAEKRGLPAVAEFKFQIETTRTQILIQALVQDELSRNPIKDAEIQAEYQRLITQLNTEYRARHILVETEAMAKDIVARLNKGEKFDALAKSLSKDPGSAANGGDLDWASADTFVGPFSEAMVKLEKGKTTAAPVQTQFGWHVIRLDDIRKSEPPALEEVRDQIADALQRKRLSDFQQTLKARAKIQ